MRWNVSVAALSASWGLIAIIVAGVELDAIVLVFLRLALAALAVAAGLLVVGRRDLFLLPAMRLRTVAVGVGLGAHWLLFFLTIKLASVAVAVLTVYAAPVLLAALAPLVLPEARSRVALAALIPATAGLALIAVAGEGDAPIRPLALATGLGAALTYALLVIGTKHLTSRLPVASITLWYYATSAVALAPLLLTAERLVPRGIEIVYVLLLGVVFTGASGIAYVWLLRKVTAQAVGVLAYLEPVSAALLAWAILDERLTPAVLAGGALVVAAGVLVVLFEPGEAAPAEAAPVAAGAVGGHD